MVNLLKYDVLFHVDGVCVPDLPAHTHTPSTRATVLIECFSACTKQNLKVAKTNVVHLCTSCCLMSLSAPFLVPWPSSTGLRRHPTSCRGPGVPPPQHLAELGSRSGERGAGLRLTLPLSRFQSVRCGMVYVTLAASVANVHSSARKTAGSNSPPRRRLTPDYPRSARDPAADLQELTLRGKRRAPPVPGGLTAERAVRKVPRTSAG